MVCGALLFTIWFTSTTYSSLIDFITVTLNRPDLKPLIVTSLFTYNKYLVIYKLHWVLYPLIAGVSILLLRYRTLIIGKTYLAICFIQISLHHIHLFYKKLVFKEKIIIAFLLIFYLISVLLNNYFKEISYDEAWGYHYYINKPFFFPFILFNTYPLFNLITHFFTFLPFNTLQSIRVPSLLFGLQTLLILFYTIYKHFGFFLSVSALLVLLSSPLFYTYSTLSRGITLSLLFSVIVLHITLQIIAGNSFNNREKFLFVIANLFGIVSMPTFFIFTISTSLYLIFLNYKQRKFVKSILSLSLVIFLGSLIFYLPVLLNAGTSLIYHNNHYVFSMGDLAIKGISFLIGLCKLFFASKWIGVAVLFFALVSLITKHSSFIKKRILQYCIFVIGCTLIFRAFSGNIFPERSLNYLVFCFVVLLLLFAETLLRKTTFRLNFTLAVSFVVLFVFSSVYNHKVLYSAIEDRDAKVIGALLMKYKIETVYIDEDEFWIRVPMIEYYYSQQNEAIQIATSALNSTRFRPFNLDDKYDCIVCKPLSGIQIQSAYLEIFRNKDFVLWKKL